MENDNNKCFGDSRNLSITAGLATGLSGRCGENTRFDRITQLITLLLIDSLFHSQIEFYILSSSNTENPRYISPAAKKSSLVNN